MLIIHRYEIQQIFHSLNLLLKYYTGQKGRSVCDEFAWFVGSRGPLFTINSLVYRSPQVNWPFKERPQHSLVKVIVRVY